MEKFDHIRDAAWFDYFSRRLGSTQLTHASARLDQLECVVKLLERVIGDLPARRDWLDPDIERLAKEFLANERKK